MTVLASIDPETLRRRAGALTAVGQDPAHIPVAALAEAGINIEIISTSSIRISCVVRASEVEHAVQAVHDQFEVVAEERADA